MNAIQVVAIPWSPATTAQFSQCLASHTGNHGIVLLFCHWQEPGIVWKGLYQLLFASPKRIARRALSALFQVVGFNVVSGSLPDHVLPDKTLVRRFQLPPSNPNLIVWIQPPTNTYFHAYFGGILIAFEHQMILYQTMAAWLSTLGGGHFFCRDLQTAATLASKQRRVALLMGDYDMAYKCTINEAYSYIYAGRFSLALKTIDSIHQLNKRLDVRPLSTLILNMAGSAKLFAKRVRKCSKTLAQSTSSKTNNYDDYHRVRVVTDKIHKERV